MLKTIRTPNVILHIASNSTAVAFVIGELRFVHSFAINDLTMLISAISNNLHEYHYSKQGLTINVDVKSEMVMFKTNAGEISVYPEECHKLFKLIYKYITYIQVVSPMKVSPVRAV